MCSSPDTVGGGVSMEYTSRPRPSGSGAADAASDGAPEGSATDEDVVDAEIVDEDERM